MENNLKGNGELTSLARLIGQMPERPGQSGGPIGGVTASLWQRLDMERISRRLIQTARIAAGEHALQRAEEAVRQRDALRAGTAAAGMLRTDQATS